MSNADRQLEENQRKLDAAWKLALQKGQMANANRIKDRGVVALQDRGLGFSRGLSDRLGAASTEYTNNNRGLRSRYLGNEAAYTKARVNPLLEQVTAGRGERERGYGLRGLGGSSFAGQDLTNYDMDTGRALGDARAMAETENLGALSQIDKNQADNIYQTVMQQAKLNRENYEVAESRIKEELALMGLSQKEIEMYLKDNSDRQNRQTTERGQDFNLFGNIIG